MQYVLSIKGNRMLKWGQMSIWVGNLLWISQAREVLLRNATWKPRLESRWSIWPRLLRSFLVLKLKAPSPWDPSVSGKPEWLVTLLEWWERIGFAHHKGTGTPGRGNCMWKGGGGKELGIVREGSVQGGSSGNRWGGRARQGAGREVEALVEFWLIGGTMERYWQVLCREWYDLIF